MFLILYVEAMIFYIDLVVDASVRLVWFLAFPVFPLNFSVLVPDGI
jgi:hypothetical protein